jgi:hypothetical protein
MNDRRGLSLGVVLALVGAFFLLRQSVAFSGPGPTLLLLGAIPRHFGPALVSGPAPSRRRPPRPRLRFLLQNALEPWMPRWATLLAGLGAGFLLIAGLDRAAGRRGHGSRRP